MIEITARYSTKFPPKNVAILFFTRLREVQFVLIEQYILFQNNRKLETICEWFLIRKQGFFQILLTFSTLSESYYQICVKVNTLLVTLLVKFDQNIFLL